MIPQGAQLSKSRMCNMLTESNEPLFSTESGRKYCKSGTRAPWRGYLSRTGAEKIKDEPGAVK